MSHSNTAAPGEESKQTAQAASMMNCSMSMGSRSLLPSYFAIWSILPSTPCRYFNIVFA